MTDATMPNDEEEIAPRPRTMKRVKAAPTAEPEAPTDDEDIPRRPVVEKDPESEPALDDDEEPVAPIHGGWTAGQQIMDSNSQYAQALRLTSDVQIVKFLEDQPYANYSRHWVDRITATGPTRLPFTCLESVGRDCPLCNIADRPQAVSSFNVVIVGDDGQVLLRTWDVGPRLFNVLKAVAADPKVGPLTRPYFTVSQTGKRQQAQTNVNDKDARWLADRGIPEPTEAMLRKVGKYDASIIRIPKKSDLQEIANELASEV